MQISILLIVPPCSIQLFIIPVCEHAEILRVQERILIAMRCFFDDMPMEIRKELNSCIPLQSDVASAVPFS